MALTQKDLNRGECAVPGCDHSNHDRTLFFHGRCHPHSPVTVAYVKATGTIVVRCHRCTQLVAEVEVKPE